MRDRVVEFYVKTLLSVWIAINANVSFIIDIFVYQQEGRIFFRSGFMPEYLFLYLFGWCVFFLLSGRERGVWKEVACVVLLIFIGFYISDWKQSYVEYSLVDEELKAACYATLSNIRITHFLWIPIWHGTRFLGRNPITWGNEMIIPVMVIPLIGGIGRLVLQSLYFRR